MSCLPALLVIGISTASSAGHAQGTVPRGRSLAGVFDRTSSATSPGAVVVVLRDGEVVLSRAQGLANIETNEAATTRTRFRLASISKSFTALLALQLVERGRLSLDDPIEKYVSGLAGGDRILVRHVLSHTAGLPDFMSLDDALKLVPDGVPGVRLNYSNLGYALLARVIEKAGGGSYEEQLRERILEPLGMSDTGVDRGEAAEPGWAKGYLYTSGGGVTRAGYSRLSGESVAAGGLYSTAEDMTRWLQALLSGRIVKPATLALATEPVRLADGRRGAYGLGFTTAHYRGLAEFGHGGDISGFNSWFSVYPDERLAVVVLSNVGMRPAGALPAAGDIAHQVVQEVASGRLGPEWPPMLDVPLQVIERYTGRYRLLAPAPVVEVMGATLDVALDSGHVIASSKMGKAEIYPESETVFFSRGPARITFVAATDGGSCSGAVLTLMGLREFRLEREQ
jgi:D-alanyl-D-alanine carboxypeptidase